MCALTRLAQIESARTLHNINLMIEICFKDLFQRKLLRDAVDQCQIDDAVSILKLRITEELIEDQVRICVLFQFDADAKTLSVGFIADVVDTIDTLFLCKLRDRLDQLRLIDHVRDLRYDDALTVLDLGDLGFRANGQLASSGRIGCADAGSAHDDTAGREIRSLDELHQLLKARFRIFDQIIESVDDLTEIMRRDM